MRLPEDVRAVRRKKLVVWIVRSCGFKRWMARVQDKQDDTKSKKIDDLALVRLLCMNFRSHKSKRANIGAV